MGTIKDRIGDEVRELIPVTLFFLVAFQLLALTQMLMLDQFRIRSYPFFAAAIGSLLVAKVVVIADHFKWVNRFPDRPLIWNVLWKTAIYFVASLVVRYAEHIVRGWRQTGSFAHANRELAEHFIWSRFVVVQLWLLVLLLVYCALRELVRAIGSEQVLAMFFREPPSPPA